MFSKLGILKNLMKLDEFIRLVSINQSARKANEHDKNKEFCEASNEGFSFVDQLRYERLAVIHRKSYLNQKKLVFIHNPRTGGQSFAKLAYGKSLGHLTASKIKTAIGSDEYENRISIGFVRDPVERLISAYNFSHQGGTTIIKPNRIRRVPRWALERFDIFCREWLFKEEKENLDLVFRSQYLWFFSRSGKVLVKNIYDFKSIKYVAETYFGPKHNLTCINSAINNQQKEGAPKETLRSEILEYYKKDIKLLGAYWTRQN